MFCDAAVRMNSDPDTDVTFNTCTLFTAGPVVPPGGALRES